MNKRRNKNWDHDVRKEFLHRDWDTLPDVALSKVFQHLDEKDRYSASLVCKAWSRGFRFPELWRKIEYSSFPGYCGRKALKFMNSLGEHVKELKMQYLGSKYSVNKECIQGLLEFLFILTKKPISLRKFTFSQVPLNYRIEDYCENGYDCRSKMEKLIQDFLGKQGDMVHFDMSFCETYLQVGIEFLSQLVKNNSIISLRYLNIENFFHGTSEVLSSPVYHGVMGSFKSLVELSINYSYIDSNVLRRLVENCYRSLKVIKINCKNEEDQKDHVIPNATWAWMRTKCPQLEVHVHISDIKKISDYIHIIPSEMGLHTFNVDAGGHFNRGLNTLVTQLCKFQETLVNVTLTLPSSTGNIGGIDFDDRSLIELVSSCSKLKSCSFQFYGGCSTKTIKAVLGMQLSGVIRLRRCSFTVYGEVADEKSIQNMCRQCQKVSEQKGASFYFKAYKWPLANQ